MDIGEFWLTGTALIRVLHQASHYMQLEMITSLPFLLLSFEAAGKEVVSDHCMTTAEL